MKKEIIKIIGFMQESERAECTANELIIFFKNEIVTMLDFCKAFNKVQTDGISEDVVDWYFKQLKQ
jgi:hypothetical protein